MISGMRQIQLGNVGIGTEHNLSPNWFIITFPINTTGKYSVPEQALNEGHPFFPSQVKFQVFVVNIEAQSQLFVPSRIIIFDAITGWWFGTFFIFPCIGNNHPNWLIFFRGVETTNQKPMHTLSYHIMPLRILEWSYAHATSIAIDSQRLGWEVEWASLPTGLARYCRYIRTCVPPKKKTAKMEAMIPPAHITALQVDPFVPTKAD